MIKSSRGGQKKSKFSLKNVKNNFHSQSDDTVSNLDIIAVSNSQNNLDAQSSSQGSVHNMDSYQNSRSNSLTSVKVMSL